MSGSPTIAVPAGQDTWVSTFARNIENYVQWIKRGPQFLTTYTTGPTAGAPKRALAFDETNNVPNFADKNGTWKDLLASGGAASVSTLSITQGAVISGTWTPVLSNTTNVSASTALQCQYLRVGSVVSFSGGVSVTPTLLATLTTLGLTLPITSNFSAAQNLGGSANSASVASASAAMFADTVTPTKATFQMVSVGTGAEVFYFAGDYLII